MSAAQWRITNTETNNPYICHLLGKKILANNIKRQNDALLAQLIWKLTVHKEVQSPYALICEDPGISCQGKQDKI